MVTVKKKSAAAIAGFVLFLQGPMPAWAQEAAEVVQNTQAQTEVTAKASTENKLLQVEHNIEELKSKIDEQTKNLEDVVNKLNKTIENINTFTKGIAKKEKELDGINKVIGTDLAQAQAVLKDLKKKKQLKEVELKSLEIQKEQSKDNYEKSKNELDSLISLESEESSKKDSYEKIYKTMRIRCRILIQTLKFFLKK